VEGRVDCAFEDLGEPELKNIARRVRVYRVLPDHGGEVPANPSTLPGKPSIAVLPFQNMSGDAEQEYFVDGMVEEIITALSRIRWLFVLARNSSFTYKGQAVDVKQVGRELGVRYVLEGSVRKGGNRVRITGQLIDAVTGAHLWADRFDGLIEDVFELQDKVASSVAGVIEPALQAAETVRSAGRPADDLTAYDLYLRAYAMYMSSGRQIPEALRPMEQAITRDPRYGPALAWAALCCFRLILDDRSTDPEADRLKGTDFARPALEVAGDDPHTLATAAHALAYFGEDIGAHDGVSRPRPRVQSELCARLGHQRQPQGVGRSARNRDRAYRGRAAPQSARRRRPVALCNRLRALCQLALRRGSAETTPRDPGGSKLSGAVSHPRRLLRAYGPD
jgi:TolB-like protein